MVEEVLQRAGSSMPRNWLLYGHTHLTDVILPDELMAEDENGKVSLTALNVPGGLKDYTEKHRQKLCAVCL